MSILAWNIESGGSEVATIARELTMLESFDILALSEVPQESTATFVSKWGKEHSIVGETGGPARILITWNPKVFDKIETLELRSFQGKEFAPGIQFSPSVAHLKHKPSGAEFILVMNHFTRGSAELRKSQALLLADWGRNQKQPCIAVGGYNFDYDFPTKKGNESFSAFMETKVWKWIEPLEWVDNNWADRNRDGKDDYPDSMLDFTFTCHAPDSWKITSKVVVRAGDFPDNDKTSDHRPMVTTVSGLTPSKSR